MKTIGFIHARIAANLSFGDSMNPNPINMRNWIKQASFIKKECSCERVFALSFVG